MPIDNGNHPKVTNHAGSPADGHYPSCPHANVCPHCGAPMAAPATPYARPYPTPWYPWIRQPYIFINNTGKGTYQ